MFQSFSVNIPTIPEKEFDLRAYGAIGDGRTSNTDAFRKAIEAAAEEGGKVIVPNGIWLTGPIRLYSNVELHLQDNAVILFDKNPEEYPLVVTDFEGITRIRTKSPIYAENALTSKGSPGSARSLRSTRKTPRILLLPDTASSMETVICGVRSKNLR